MKKQRPAPYFVFKLDTRYDQTNNWCLCLGVKSLLHFTLIIYCLTSEMYTLNLRNRYSRKTYTFTWIIEDSKDLTLDFQRGPLFKVSGEQWYLELHKHSTYYGFKLYRRVSGFEVSVKAEIKVINAEELLLNELSTNLYSPKSEETNTCFHLDILSETTENVNFEEVNSALTKKYFSWKDYGENKYYPNMIKFKLNLEFCFLVIPDSSHMTHEELEKQAQISLSKDVLVMLKNKTETDVNIRILTKFKSGHKLILAARCPVFAKILRQNPKKRKIELDWNFKEVSRKTINMLFDFIYTKVRYDYSDIDNAGNNSCNLTLNSLYYVAKELEMHDLKKLILTLLLREIAPKKAGYLLLMADNFSDDMLKHAVLEFVKDNFKACCREDFLGMADEEDKSRLYKEVMRMLSD